AALLRPPPFPTRRSSDLMRAGRISSTLRPVSGVPDDPPSVEATMGQQQPRSPRITHLSWGRMEVEGVGAGRDFKLYPGGGREWRSEEHTSELQSREKLVC